MSSSNVSLILRGIVWATIVTVIGISLVSLATDSRVNESNSSMEIQMKFNELTAEEKRVITNKGTEAPFTGKYLDNKAEGTYICKRCDTPLYYSQDKFESGCGWPSFDDEISGAVKRSVDADGRRTEITCANCGAHLGHVFEGEQFTPKNVRHCVNSISLNFVPAAKQTSTVETAYFAGGCFWGVEHLLGQVEGVMSTRVGYMGGHTEDPTYGEVCRKTTGHAEAVEVVFDPMKVSYEQLARLFFEIHDPTQRNRQGPDIGEQYRSAVFYASEVQRVISERLIVMLKDKGYEVVTELAPADTFWVAEDYHQDYYDKTGIEPYCHIYTKRF